MKYMISWFERPQGSPIEYEKYRRSRYRQKRRCVLLNGVGGSFGLSISDPVRAILYDAHKRPRRY